MQKTITLCDKEGCRKGNTQSNSVYSCTESDPSGHGSNSWFYVFDLCREHQKEYERKAGGLEREEASKALRKLKIGFRVR